MKSIRRGSLAILILMLGLQSLNAQELHQCIGSAGGNISGDEGSLDYSVGLLVYTTISGEAGSIDQGILEIIEVVDLAENRLTPELAISVFPNPATDQLILKTDVEDQSGLEFQLYDNSGNLLRKIPVSSTETTLDLSGLEPAIYLLSLSRESTQLKTFKILKK